MLVIRVVTLVGIIGWAGFWIAVARLHYLQQDWGGLVLAVITGIAPGVALALWEYQPTASQTASYSV